MAFWHRWGFARKNQDLQDEINSHVAIETQQRMDRGESADDARRNALRDFGNVDLVRAATRDTWGWIWLEQLLQDLGYAIRSLTHMPGFSIIAILTLALGVGVNTSIFTVVNSVLLRPLPYPDPDRLAWVTERFTLSFGTGAVLGPDYVEWQRQNKVFQQIEAFGSEQGPGASLSGTGEPIPVRVTGVTGGFFSMLGLHPIAGRSFTTDDGREGQDQVLLLSEDLWRGQFGGSPSVIGRTVRLDNSPYRVVGVMPANIRFPEADIWRPIATNSASFFPKSRPLSLVTVLGRLKPGITLSQAKSNLSVITHNIDQDYPLEFVRLRDREVDVVPLHAVLVRNVRSLLLILLGTVSFVFLIACANVANLSLSRAAARSREFAVREALGAGRTRLVRQLFTESLLLAVLGSAFGLVSGLWSVRLLRYLIPPSLPGDIGLDWRILVFEIAMATLAALVFGLAPALMASRTEVGESLKAGTVQVGTGKGARHLRSALVICEIALSLILLIGAGLLVRSFMHLTNVQLGFNSDHILTVQLRRAVTNDLQTPSQIPFFNDVLGKISALPGVDAAAATSRPPLSACNGTTGPVRLRGATNDLQSICTTFVTARYFGAMEIRVLNGRSFTDQDSANAQPVVIVNEALARKGFEDGDPIGREIGVYGMAGISWRTVVGVIADTRNGALEQQPVPEIFVPYPQAMLRLPPFTTFVLRTNGNPLALVDPVRKAVQTLDKNQAISNTETLDEVIASYTSPQWLRALLVGLFAFVAMALAAIGVFGVMAYSMSQRTREIGVRVALGAQPRDIVVLAVSSGMSIAAIGLGIGLLGALMLTPFLSSFLYDIKTTDHVTFLTALLVLAGAALFACYVPARRAARMDPLSALKNE